jgi:hypothetical protein
MMPIIIDLCNREYLSDIMILLAALINHAVKTEDKYILTGTLYCTSYNFSDYYGR